MLLAGIQPTMRSLPPTFRAWIPWETLPMSGICSDARASRRMRAPEVAMMISRLVGEGGNGVEFVVFAEFDEGGTSVGEST